MTDISKTIDALADGERIPVEAVEKDGVFAFRIKKERLAGVVKLRLFGEFTEAAAGDDGYYLCPRKLNMDGEFLCRFTPRPDVVYRWDKPILSLFGIKKPGLTALVRIKRNYKYRLEVSVADGRYLLCVEFDFSVHDPVYQDVEFEIIRLPDSAGYREMAAAERNIRLSRGEITPLGEKCLRPAVEYARRYPLIRIRMGWKPSPCSVFSQTPENEPDMFVACDFGRVCDIADALRENGVEGAEIQLVGWNISGHDGRFPQLFPVDERLGGEDGLKKAIAHVKSCGYRVSLHTNLIDAYEIADCFDWDDIVVERDGSFCRGGQYGGGQSWHVCTEAQKKNCEKDLERIASLGLDGLHFTDVISIVEPDDCHSEAHPVSTSQGIRDVGDIMDRIRERMGGFSSEGTMDFAVGKIDYGLYVSFGDGFGRKPVPVADCFLPFFELVYHGIILYNPLSPSVNYPIKTPRERLYALLRGGRPTFYFFSKFRTGGSANWMGETDLVTTTDEDLAFSCRTVAGALREYRETGLDRLQLEYMTDYRVEENGIEYAEYADGTVVCGNFGKDAAVFRGRPVPSGGFVVISREKGKRK